MSALDSHHTLRTMKDLISAKAGVAVSHGAGMSDALSGLAATTEVMGSVFTATVVSKLRSTGEDALESFRAGKEARHALTGRKKRMTAVVVDGVLMVAARGAGITQTASRAIDLAASTGTVFAAGVGSIVSASYNLFRFSRALGRARHADKKTDPCVLLASVTQRVEVMLSGEHRLDFDEQVRLGNQFLALIHYLEREDSEPTKDKRAILAKAQKVVIDHGLAPWYAVDDLAGRDSDQADQAAAWLVDDLIANQKHLLAQHRAKAAGYGLKTLAHGSAGTAILTAPICPPVAIAAAITSAILFITLAVRQGRKHYLKALIKKDAKAVFAYKILEMKRSNPEFAGLLEPIEKEIATLEDSSSDWVHGKASLKLNKARVKELQGKVENLLLDQVIREKAGFLPNACVAHYVSPERRKVLVSEYVKAHAADAKSYFKAELAAEKVSPKMSVVMAPKVDAPSPGASLLTRKDRVAQLGRSSRFALTA